MSAEHPAATPSGRQAVFAAADRLAYVAKLIYPQNDEVARALNGYWNAKRELAAQQWSGQVIAHMENESPKELLMAALDCLGGDDHTPTSAELEGAATTCIQAAMEALPSGD